MNYYETTILLNSKLAEEEVKKANDKLVSIFKTNGGEIVEIEKNGIKKLPYAVKNNSEANYLLIKHNSTGDSINPIKSQMRLLESILLFMVIKVHAGKEVPKPAAAEASE